MVLVADNSLNRGRIHKLELTAIRWGIELGEESPFVSDSVVMGNVNIDNTICPSCDAINVRVMKCQESDCDCRFCEICNPNSRFNDVEISLHRFDSGIGSGPFCSSCLRKMVNDAIQRKEEEESSGHRRQGGESISL